MDTPRMCTKPQSQERFGLLKGTKACVRFCSLARFESSLPRRGWIDRGWVGSKRHRKTGKNDSSFVFTLDELRSICQILGSLREVLF